MAGPSRDGANDPGPLDDATVAERWAELTADLGHLEVPDDLDEDPPARDGAQADEPADGAPPAEPDAAPPAEHATPRRTPRPLGPRDYLEPEDPEEDRFVPPDPRPLENTDPVLTLGWVATVGSLLLGLVLYVVASPDRWLMLCLGAALLCGVGLLLWRMPAGRDGDDDGGDGAVV